jgi:hypothetical protein
MALTTTDMFVSIFQIEKMWQFMKIHYLCYVYICSARITLSPFGNLDAGKVIIGSTLRDICRDRQRGNIKF